MRRGAKRRDAAQTGACARRRSPLLAPGLRRGCAPPTSPARSTVSLMEAWKCRAASRLRPAGGASGAVHVARVAGLQVGTRTVEISRNPLLCNWAKRRSARFSADAVRKTFSPASGRPPCPCRGRPPPGPGPCGKSAAARPGPWRTPGSADLSIMALFAADVVADVAAIQEDGHGRSAPANGGPAR